MARIPRGFKDRVLELADNPEGLEDLWADYCEIKNDGTLYYYVKSKNIADFIPYVNKILAEAKGFTDRVFACGNCAEPQWQDDSDTDIDGTRACQDCRDDADKCSVCDAFCLTSYSMIEVDGDYFCESCRDSELSWCGYCDEYYRHRYADDHDHETRCDCEPQNLHFQILANSHGTLNQDERLKVEFPEGFLTDEGINSALHTLWRGQLSQMAWAGGTTWSYGEVSEAVREMDREWVTKRGTFTRRLSSLLYQKFGIKLEPGILSKVGSELRAHSGNTSEWYVEFTRDLNKSAAAFYHESSCWWGSENHSLCALKNWGGLGMRSYQSEGQDRDRPSGRAWLQPLNKDLMPTIDVFNAHAYTVYNGYGELQGYSAARIVAYLTSRTYRKVGLEISNQWLNGDGYLIADQETVDAWKDKCIRINIRNHHERIAA